MNSGLLFRSARVLLIGVILLLPAYYYRFAVAGVPTNPIEVIILVGFLLALVSFRSQLRLRFFVPISLILIGVGIGSYIAVDHEKAIGILKGWFVVPALFFWSVDNILNASDLPLVRRLLLFNLFSVSSYALLQWSGVIGLLPHQDDAVSQYVTQGRAVGFYESPNLLAMYLAPAAFLSLPLLSEVDWRLRVGAILALLTALVALFLTGSQGGYLALTVGLAFTVIVRFCSPAKALLVSLVVIVLFVVGVASLGQANQKERVAIWKKGVELIADRPILGIGPGQFSHYLNGSITELSNFEHVKTYAIHPHNTLLNFWLSGGILAIVGFVALLVAAFKRAINNWGHQTLASSAALLAILTHGMFDSTYFKNDLAIIFWLAVWGMFALRREYGHEQEAT